MKVLRTYKYLHVFAGVLCLIGAFGRRESSRSCSPTVIMIFRLLLRLGTSPVGREQSCNKGPTT